MSCVYKFTFPDNSIYIGETSADPEDRWLNGWGYREIPRVFNAIMYFGWKNVKREIVADDLTEPQARRLELKLINEYSERLLAQSDLHSEDDSTEADAQSELHSDASCTAIHNEAGIPQALFNMENDGYIVPGESRTGSRYESPTGNKKKKEANRNRIAHIPLVEKPIGVKNCPVSVYDLDGNFVAIYPTARIAAKELNVNYGDVVSCCKGCRADGVAKKRVKNYIFRYAPSVIGI